MFDAATGDVIRARRSSRCPRSRSPSRATASSRPPDGRDRVHVRRAAAARAARARGRRRSTPLLGLAAGRRRRVAGRAARALAPGAHRRPPCCCRSGSSRSRPASGSRSGCPRRRSSRSTPAKGEDIVPWLDRAARASPCSIAAWAVIELARAPARRGLTARPPAPRPRHPDRGRRRAHARGARGRRRLDVDDRADRRVGQPRRVGGLVQRRAARASDHAAVALSRSAAAEGDRLAEVGLPRGAFARRRCGADARSPRRRARSSSPRGCRARAVRRRPASTPRSRRRGSRRRCARSRARCRAAGAGTGSARGTRPPAGR